MVDHQSYACLVFLVLFSAFMFSSDAFQFIVGGKDGWGLNPSGNYNGWAERLRFQVNDTLLFKYKKGSDSVLVVSKDDYDQCNTGSPKEKMDDGSSVFKFDRSGPFFFISGNKSSCGHGEKLIIVVLAVRSNHSWSPPPPKAPSPAAAPPRWSPHSPAPQGGEAPATASSPAEDLAPETGYAPSENPTPSGEIPASHPPRRSFAATSWSPSVLLVSTVSVVISVCLGGFINFI